MRECGRQPFKKFIVCMGGAIWPNLPNLLRLLETMRETGFEPARVEYKPEERKLTSSYNGKIKTSQFVSSDSIFWMGNMEHGGVQEVLENALRLGRRAREEAWSKEKLEEELRGFAARKGKDPKPSKKGKKNKKQ